MTQLAEAGIDTRFSTREVVWGELFNDWLLDLTEAEQDVWLWNSMVAMERIKRRRK